MNIFAVDKDPVVAAESLCNSHVVKMILESAQLLFTAHRVLDPDKTMPEGAYKATHINHPSAKWVREGEYNYLWLYWHYVSLLEEYTYRYGKTHKCAMWVPYLLVKPLNINFTPSLTFQTDTPFALAMPDEYKTDDPVQSYRNYYRGAKTHLLTYTKRKPPEWIADLATYKP